MLPFSSQPHLLSVASPAFLVPPSEHPICTERRGRSGTTTATRVEIDGFVRVLHSLVFLITATTAGSAGENRAGPTSAAGALAGLLEVALVIVMLLSERSTTRRDFTGQWILRGLCTCLESAIVQRSCRGSG